MTLDIEELFRGTPARPPARKRRPWVAVGVIVSLVVILGGALVVVDVAARSFAEGRIQTELTSRLPAGSGPNTVSIEGFSFLQQMAAGSLDQVDVSIALDGAALGKLVAPDAATSPITLADGAAAYNGEVQVLGVALGYRVALAPERDGNFLVFTPTAIEATTENAAVDVAQLVDLTTLAIRVCAAELLPSGVDLTGVSITGDRMQLDLRGRDLSTDLATLTTRGSCD